MTQQDPILCDTTAPLGRTASREYGLDWLRVFAFGVLIFYHSGMAFVSWDWHIKNTEKSQVLELVMLFFNRWRLPLLFFISGAGVCFSLRRRSWGKFAGERLRRLLIPLAFAMFVVVPPQIYFEHLYRGRSYASYGEFYRTVFQFVPYPQGSFSWHHLWFVAYILVYSLAGIPIFALVKGQVGRRFVSWLAGSLEKWPITVYLINLPSLAVALWLGPKWPTTHNLIADWANLSGSFITFLWGFVIASEPRLLDLIERRRREFLWVGIVMAAAFYAMMVSGATREWPPAWRILTSAVVSGYLGMAWIFALVGYARAKLKQGGPALSYANEAVYPFYIAHQTITVGLVYYVVQCNWGVWPKVAVTVAGTFLGSWIVFEAVRRTWLTRLLFGVKEDRATKTEARGHATGQPSIE